VRDALKEPAKKELAEFVKKNVELGAKKTDKLLPPDRYYLEDRIRESKFKLSSKELAEYFEVRAVTKGLLDITAKMYDLTLKQVPAEAWHADVTAYEVWSKDKRIGKFYLDLYSRPDKYKHAAMFTLRTAKRLRDGTWQEPMAALVCNFPRPGDPPALMSHEDVQTFFHEFGHVLHQLLTRSELASYSGTATARDFGVAPARRALGELGCALPAKHQMGVAVDQTGRQPPACELDGPLWTRPSRQVRLSADPGDATRLGEHGAR
jgi:thimet oligopeptidase